MKAIPAPAAAEREPIKDVLHGTEVADPYRWLEDEKAEKVQAFMKANDDQARAFLAELPGRKKFRERLESLAYVDTRSAPVTRGDRQFWAEKPAAREKSIHYWQAEGGDKKVLLDPEKMAEDGSMALGAVVPSPDGTLVAYLEKPDNADESTLRVLEVETGKLREADVIQGLRYTEPEWTPDGKGFYYTWLPTDPEIPTNERMGFGEIRYHVLGQDPAKDETVRGKTGDATRWQGASVSDDGRWLIVSVSRGWSENEVFVKDLSKRKSDFVNLTEGCPAAIYDVVGLGDRLFVRTNDGAPRYQVFGVKAGRFARKAWKTVLPQDEVSVIDALRIIGGKLAVHRLENASSQLELRRMDGKLDHRIELPAVGSISGLTGKAGQETFYFGYESFDRPDEIWSASAKTGEAEIFHRPEVPVKPGSLKIRSVRYPSKDGTEVSMFVVSQPGVEMNGQNPTMLYGYGGFNISLTPRFSAAIVAWVEAGGVYAMPNLRGGGEYGEAWHQAGMMDRKQNVFDDFIGAGEWLVAEKYTSPEHLGISGRSNGGLLVGAAMTQRPDLFRAVLCGVPLLDMVRYHQFGIGKAWIPEYGTPEKKEDLQWLLAYSPYHNVKKGLSYPALLMLSADHDDRVDPLHARKFVAQVRWATESAYPVLLRIEENSGHGGGDMRKKWVARTADELAFLDAELGGDEAEHAAAESHAKKKPASM